MVNKTKVLVVSALVAVGAIAGTGAAIASGGDDSTIALEHTGGGTVTDTEIEDEESYYEVEVTMDDGRSIDVQLDEEFNVVGDEVDSEEDKD